MTRTDLAHCLMWTGAGKARNATSPALKSAQHSRTLPFMPMGVMNHAPITYADLQGNVPVRLGGLVSRLFLSIPIVVCIQVPKTLSTCVL